MLLTEAAECRQAAWQSMTSDEAWEAFVDSQLHPRSIWERGWMTRPGIY
jgi:hypothetical protein